MNVLNLVKQPDSYLSQSGFTFIKPLGAGASGVVGLFERNGQQYAIKIIDINRLVENEQMHHMQATGKQLSREHALGDIQKEIKNLQKISRIGPKTCRETYNFILDYEAFVDPNEPYYYLVSEPMSSDLFGFFLSREGCLRLGCPEAQIAGLANNRDELVLAVVCQLFYAIKCLHQIGLVHGDLKPENIFINGKTGQIKIADFGGSAWINGGSDIRDRQITGSTLIYTPPERLADPNVVSFGTDVWALGVILLALTVDDPEAIVDILAKKPQTEIRQIIEDRVTMAKEENEQWIKWLLFMLLELDPSRRPSIDDVLKDTRFSRQCTVPVKNVLTSSSSNGSRFSGFVEQTPRNGIGMRPIRVPENRSEILTQKLKMFKKRISPKLRAG